MAKLISSSGLFPSENVPASEKRDKPWLTKFCAAAIWNYANLPKGAIGWVSRDLYLQWHSYANGNQSIEKYKKTASMDQDGSFNQFVMDWSVMPIIPKYYQIVLGLLSKTNFTLKIDPIDPLAKNEVDEELLRMRTRIEVKDQLKTLGMEQFTNAASLMPDSPEDPEDLDGLAAMEMGVRHRTAMEVEQVTELVLNGSDYETIQQMINRDLFVTGFCALKDFKSGDTVKVRRCETSRMVISYCSDPYFADIKYVGEIHRIQASQVVAESQGQVTKEEIEMLWKLGNINFGGMQQPRIVGSWADYWNSGQLDVLDIEIYTTDTIEKEEKTDRNGNVRYWDVSRDENGKLERRKTYKYHQRQVQTILRAKWVVGTDIMYDYGLQYDIKRDPNNQAVCYGSYHLYACNLTNMRATSRAKFLMSYADAIQNASYRLQHALNSIVPNGYSINLDKIEEVNLSSGGERLSVIDILDFFFSKGILLHRNKNLAGQTEDRSKAIEPLVSTVGGDIQEFWNIIQNNLTLIQTTLGLNEVTDGSTPNPKLLNGVASAAINGTNNALSDLFYASRYLAKSLAKSIILRAQYIIKYGDADVFVNALGDGTVKILRNIKDIPKYIYGVKIEEKPTDEELAAFDVLMKEAIAQKQITIADAMQINNISNLKMKEQFLAYKVKKNLEMQKQEALQLQQQNGQIQQQSALVAEQAKQQTLKIEYDLKLRNDMAVEKEKQKSIIIQGNITLEKERLSASGRVEASFLQAKAKDESNIRDNTTKLINEDRPDQVEIINIPAELKSQVEPITSPEEPNLPIEEEQFSFLEEPSFMQQPSENIPAEQPELVEQP